MNYGTFKDGVYTKQVVFSKAVLWHTRELSLRADIMERIRSEGIKKIVFRDRLKGETWTFNPEKVFDRMRLKSGGQEPQYYFPIDLARKTGKRKKKEVESKPKPEYEFDPVRNVYVEKAPEIKTEPAEVKQMSLI